MNAARIKVNKNDDVNHGFPIQILSSGDSVKILRSIGIIPKTSTPILEATCDGCQLRAPVVGGGNKPAKIPPQDRREGPEYERRRQ
jgi:hypothetical protein